MAGEATVDSILIKVSSNAQQAESGITAAANALRSLRQSMPTDKQVARLKTLAANMGELTSKMRGASSAGVVMRSIASSLRAFDGVSGPNKTTASNLSAIINAVKGVTGSDADALGRVGASLSGFKDVKISKATATNLRSLVGVVDEYKEMDFGGFTAEVDKLSKSLGRLGDAMGKVGVGYRTMPRSFKSAGTAKRSVESANYSWTSNLAGFVKNLGARGSTFAGGGVGGKNSSNTGGAFGGLGGMRDSMIGVLGAISPLQAGLAGLSAVLSACLNKANSYVEDMNLFYVSMGRGASAAEDFANRAQDLMGIDAGEWMRNQGVFDTLIAGMGVATDKADVMSKQMTQLGYDLSSFFNISTDDAMLKIQSGLSGELEPLRRLGFDLSEAKMQQTAYNLGIKESVQDMTQATKVQLRYYMIMTQVSQAHGDMARTIDQPANAMRVFHAQVTVLARNIGQLLIPILNAVLPYLTAITMLATEATQALAKMLGIKLPKADLSTVDRSGMGAVADNAQKAEKNTKKATKAAKEYKRQLLGFDKINNLSLPSNTKKSGSKDANKGQSNPDIPMPTYDMFEGFAGSKAKKALQWMKDNLSKILAIAGAIGGAMLAWKYRDTLIPLMKNLAGRIRDAWANQRALNKSAKDYRAVKRGKPVVTNNRVVTTYTVRDRATSVLERIRKAQHGIANRVKIRVSIVGGSALWAGGKMGTFAKSAGRIAKAVAPWAVAIAAIGGWYAYMYKHDPKFRKGVEKLGKLVKPFVKTVSKIATMVGKAINKGLKTATKFVGDLWKNVKNIASKLTKSIGKTVKNIAKTVGDMWENIIKKLREMDLDWLADILETIGKVVGDIANGIGTIVKGIGDFLGGVLGGIGDAITGILGNTDIASVGVGVLGAAMVATGVGAPIGVFLLLADALQLIIKYIGEIDLSKPIKDIQKFGENAGKTLQDIGEKAKVKVDVSGVVTTVTNGIKGAIDWVVGGIGGLVDNVKKGAHVVADFVVNGIKGFVDNIAKTADAVSRFLKDPIGSIKGVVENISKTADAVGDFVKEKIPGLSGIVDKVEKAKNVVIDKALKALDGIEAWVSDFKKDPKATIDKSIKDGLSGLKGIVTDIAAKTGLDLSPITNLVNDLKGKVTDLGAKAGIKVPSSLNDVISNLQATITGIGDNIKGGVDSVKKKVEGWVTGIKATVSNVDKAPDLQGKLDAAVRGLAATIGIRIPSKEEMQDGIKKKYKSLRIAAKKMGIDIPKASVMRKRLKKMVKKAGRVIYNIHVRIMTTVKKIKNVAVGVVAALKDQINKKVIANLRKIPIIGNNIPWLYIGNGEKKKARKIGYTVRAKGGFVPDGQMFVARERGPEMVGTMGRQTAVANNQQIVRGIANGVASANAAQNHLLQEQNRLLRQLLAKDNGVTITGTDLAKAMTRSSRVTGRPVYSG